MRLTGHGITADLPRGWEGVISISGVGAPTNDSSARRLWLGEERRPTPGRTFPFAQFGNFALPPVSGDFGGAVVGAMGRRDVFASLLEYGPEFAGTALFSARLPRELEPSRFNRRTLQRTLPGQAGYQAFLTERDRAFCLYVVLGGTDEAPRLVGELNGLLRRIVIGFRT